ncbi:MAG TPA: hypothetical protein VJP80_08675 [Candidatus Saccharimonadales bacterium]|nr:hypothetical protein [Candidatus Saccharimonadales bacterium]
MKFIRNWRTEVFGLLVIVLISGCTATSNVVLNPTETGRTFTSVYLVTHGGHSVDMDNAFRKALMQRGLKVTEGETEPQTKSTDLVVKYDDTWRWDIAMYLLSLDVQIYDSKTGALVAESEWHNSPAHTWPNVDTVVGQLMQQTFNKLNAKTPLP